VALKASAVMSSAQRLPGRISAIAVSAASSAGSAAGSHGLLNRMVTLSVWCLPATSLISIFALGLTRAPSRLTITPSTLTQPFSIHSSAARREHTANSLTSFDNRGDSLDKPR
jgi:hypothetical protein